MADIFCLTVRLGAFSVALPFCRKEKNPRNPLYIKELRGFLHGRGFKDLTSVSYETPLARTPPKRAPSRRSSLKTCPRQRQAASSLGTRCWSGCGRTLQAAGERTVYPGSCRKPRRGRGWFGAANNFLGNDCAGNYHFFLRKKRISAKRMAKLTKITTG